MKAWMGLLLLCAFCRSGDHLVYNLNLNPLQVPSGAFSNELKVAADLNAELRHDLMRTQMGSVDEADWPKYNDKSSGKTQRHICEQETEKQEIENFVGTNLFDGNRKSCFSTEDVALLAARRDFEMLIPEKLPQCLLNDEMVNVLMQYFHTGSKIIKETGDDFAKRLVEKAFYDTLGGYMRYYVVPVTKFSFYAGTVNLKTVKNVVKLFQQCKTFLNTNGNGWKTPMSDLLNDLKDVQIEPLKDTANCEEPSSCAMLDLSSVNNDVDDEQMIVALPKLDAEDCDGHLNNVWLPFKRKRTFNLRASKSAFIVVKFYETVTRCYGFQHQSQDTYNRKFKEWILENVQVHLSDEEFYPGLGAILRIYENLRRGKKAIQFQDIDSDGNFQPFSDHEYHNDEELDEAYLDDNGDNKPAMESVTDGVSGRKCKPKTKPKCKPRKKPKCKGKNTTTTHTEESKKGDSMVQTIRKFLNSPKQKRLFKYIGYGVALIVLLLLLVLLIVLIVKCAKKAKSRRKYKPAPLAAKPSPIAKSSSSEKQTTKAPVVHAAKKRRLCDRLLRRKKKDGDEEILIKPESNSVIASKLRPDSTSTSQVTCGPRKKCLPLAKLTQKPNTGNLSSTATDAKGKTKTQKKPKVSIVNEKKNAKSKSKSTKESSPCPSSDSSRRRSSSRSLDIQSSKSKCASGKNISKCSWETMYDS